VEVDKKLLEQTKELDAQFVAAARTLSHAKDPRIFFTYAHGYITSKIAKHITLLRILIHLCA
jgi:hypothetical protein